MVVLTIIILKEGNMVTIEEGEITIEEETTIIISKAEQEIISIKEGISQTNKETTTNKDHLMVIETDITNQLVKK